MQADDEKLNNQRIGVLQCHNKQSGRSGLGLSNFIQTKHAREHFDLLIHVDIKSSKNENFSIIQRKTIYFLDQEYMLSRKPHPSQREEGSGHTATIELLPGNAIIEHSG